MMEPSRDVMQAPSSDCYVPMQVKRLLNAAYERAQAVLRQNEHELHALAKQLLEQESLTGTQIKELLENLKKQTPSTGTAPAAAA